jgi:hypothetical protein
MIKPGHRFELHVAQVCSGVRLLHLSGASVRRGHPNADGQTMALLHESVSTCVSPGSQGGQPSRDRHR